MEEDLANYKRNMKRGETAYWLRVRTNASWASIASDSGFTTGRGTMSAAKAYAKNHNLAWPLKRYTKGAAIYKARRVGMTWMAISIRYKQTIEQIQSCAYKYAVRHDYAWPPKEVNNE
jgi:hypothetical protein